MKTPPTPAGIEPATYRFVAQHLNHCPSIKRTDENINEFYQSFIYSPTDALVSCLKKQY